MSHFLADNWIALLSLAVALIGGIPGLLAVLDHLRLAPEFGVSMVNVVVGHEKRGGHERVMLLFTLTAWNKGERPVTPASFDMDLRKGRRWVRLERSLIPPDIELKSNEQLIEIQPQDLQLVTGSIAPDKPVSGHLMFNTVAFTLSELRSSHEIRGRLICHDIFARKHRAKFTFKLEAIDQTMVYPKHGLRIASKPSPKGPNSRGA